MTDFICILIRVCQICRTKFGSTIPRYPSRQQVVDYLEDYKKEFNITPLFNIEAKTIKGTVIIGLRRPLTAGSNQSM
jgi:hypothetical protein